MNEHFPSDRFLWRLFQHFRRRHFPLGIDDYRALHQAVREGFGWKSTEAFCELCCALWAKSCKEREVLIALFKEFNLQTWELTAKHEDIEKAFPFPLEPPEHLSEKKKDTTEKFTQDNRKEETADEVKTSELKTQSQKRIPDIPWKDVTLPKKVFTFVPQYPLSFREIVQIWRRLRRPVREGPPVELDIKATITQCCEHSGIVSPVVLIPRRRNRVRLLLLIDREGSMTPFHNFIDEVCLSIQKAARIEEVAVYYFHNIPIKKFDKNILHKDEIRSKHSPTFDTILSQIEPNLDGTLYSDPEMYTPHQISDVLETHAVRSGVVIISDGGAAREKYEPIRLLKTIIFIKTLHRFTSRYLWLNPLPEKPHWENTTAAQIRRHIPMFPLNQTGMHQAINVLHGKPYVLEKPL